MTRNRERRSFTVAAKSSGHQGFVSIPAKAPRVPQAAARKSQAAGLWEPIGTVAGPQVAAASSGREHRRILPNLIAWEAPAPEPEVEITREPPLPRVRRVTSPGTLDEAPRRRGRPRKVLQPIDSLLTAPLRKSEPAPVLATPRTDPVIAKPQAKPIQQRKQRPESETLRLGERWKRRLPRSCW